MTSQWHVPLALTVFMVVITGVACDGPQMKPPQGSLLLRPVQLQETTTPPPSAGIFLKIYEEIYASLQNSPYQRLNALFALILGVVMVFKGEKLFICALIFVMSSSVMGEQVSILLGLNSTSLLRHIVAAETGLISAYAAYKGIDGVMIMLAVILGVCFGVMTRNFGARHGANFLEDNWVQVGFYTLFCLLGYLLFFHKRQQWLLFAIISPLLGGLLFTSALFYGVTSLAVNGYLDFLLKMSNQFQPMGGSYVEFVSLLISKASKDVGLFAGRSFHGISVDCWCGRIMWVLLFVIGGILQFRTEFKLKKKNAAEAKNGELKQPLLC